MRAMAPGFMTSSLQNSHTYSPRARSTVRARSRSIPPRSSRRWYRKAGKRSSKGRTSSVVLSVDPPSSTTTSTPSGACGSTLSRVSLMNAPKLKVGMQMESRIGFPGDGCDVTESPFP